MTDRELLEAAARAAGMALMWSRVEDVSPVRADTMGSWNPLHYDDDALRLAVKLQLTVCNEHLSAGVAYCTGPDGESYPEVGAQVDTGEPLCADDYAATRRAIVRAAAALAPER
jgi:hypothetical protein